MSHEPIQTPDPVPSTKSAAQERTEWAVLILAVVSVFSIIGWLLSQHLTQKAVKCQGTDGGYVCSIIQTEAKSEQAYVCWDIVRLCANGQRSIAHKCGQFSMGPDVPAQAIVSNAEFSNADTCPTVSAVTIENVVQARTEGDLSKPKP